MIKLPPQTISPLCRGRRHAVGDVAHRQRAKLPDTAGTLDRADGARRHARCSGASLMSRFEGNHAGLHTA
jgi:hypothetical protein